MTPAVVGWWCWHHCGRSVSAIDGGPFNRLNGNVRAIAFRLLRWLRRRWLSAVIVAAVVALVSGAVLMLAAGAKRTDEAPDAYTATVGGDLDGSITQESGAPRTAQVAALPGVRSVEAITFLFAAVLDPKHEPAAETISFSGSRLFTSRIVAGRAADPHNRQEFVASQSFVKDHDARLGDRYQVASWTQAQLEQGQAFSGDPLGPQLEGVLVGVLDSPQVLDDNYDTVIFSSALLDDDIALGSTIMAVRLQPGVTSSELRAKLDGLPDGGSLKLEPGQIISSEVRTAVDTQARGIWLMAAVAAIAAIVALGQLVSRQARLSLAERRPLSALGFTSGQLAGETMSRAAVPAAGGILIGTVLATLASGRFPTGFARSLDPHPGPRADFAVLVVGGVALLLGVLGWVAVALIVAPSTAARRTPALTGGAIARRAPSPTAATGIRFALTGHGSANTSTVGTLAALALLIAGLVGATTFATSLNHLVSDGSRFGHNYTLMLGDLAALSAADLRATYEGDHDIQGLMILSAAQVRAGNTTVGLIGVERVKGELAPRLLAGRLPSGPDEVALGRVTARQLHLRLGQTLALASTAASGTFRVVGLAVVPGLGSIDGAGVGGVMTPEGLTRLVPNPDTNAAAIALRPGASSDAPSRLAALVGAQQGTESPPSAILNIARVRGIPGVLAALLTGLAVLTMTHALIVSIQSRRRDLAILRALGADRRWIARAVHWQATVLTAVPLVVGVPLGLIAGSVVFRSFAGRIGTIPDPTVPIVLVLAVMVGLLAAANLAAVIPARRASVVPAARQLRGE